MNIIGVKCEKVLTRYFTFHCNNVIIVHLLFCTVDQNLNIDFDLDDLDLEDWDTKVSMVSEDCTTSLAFGNSLVPILGNNDLHILIEIQVQVTRPSR